MESNEASPPNPGVQDLLQAGSAALRSGHADWARDLLQRALELDAENASAWLWLSEAAESVEERERCLQEVLRLEPDHEEARRRLEDAWPEPGAWEEDAPPAALWLDEPAAADPDPAPVLASSSMAPSPRPGGDLRSRGHLTGEDLPQVPGSDSDFAPVIASRAVGGEAIPGYEDGDSSLLPVALNDTSEGAHDGVTPVTSPSPGVEVMLDTAAAGSEVEGLMREGIAAARSQQPERARDLLQRATEVDEKHVSAWLWLSYVAESAEERARYVQKVISLAVADAAPRPALAGALAGGGNVTLTGAGFGPVSAPVRMPRQSRSYAPPAPAIPLPSDIVEGLRTAYAEWTSTWALTAVAYMAGITVAELLTTFMSTEPRLGLAAHALLLLALFAHAALVQSKAERGFLVSLAFAPLIRVLSLTMPLAQIPILYWYLATSIPLFAALLVAAPVLGFSWIDLGLNLRRWPQQLAIGLTGILFGAVEYLILQPPALAPSLQLVHLWWPALILMVSTGLLEEMIFRGMLQRAAGEAMRRGAVAYVALLFAVLHIGYQSWADFFFVLLVGLFFGEVVQRTRSLVGVTLSHGLTNIVLFLVMPFLGWP